MRLPGIRRPASTACMRRVRKDQPPRLPIIFDAYAPPLFLVSFNTHLRRPVLAEARVHAAFREFATRAESYRIAVGRYVLMPDHVHLFVSIGGETTLGAWVKSLKQTLGKTLAARGHEPAQIAGTRLRSYWQPGFHDHLLRHEESYAQKWEYVRQNPVRAGLALEPEAWPYQGEIVRIDRV